MRPLFATRLAPALLGLAAFVVGCASTSSRSGYPYGRAPYGYGTYGTYGGGGGAYYDPAYRGSYPQYRSPSDCRHRDCYDDRYDRDDDDGERDLPHPLGQSQKEEWRDMRGEQKGEWRDLKREQEAERRRLQQQGEWDREDKIRQREQRQSVSGEQREERRDLRREQQDERQEYDDRWR